MDARVSVSPLAMRSAWLDRGLAATERLQPQVQRSSGQNMATVPDGTPVRLTAPQPVGARDIGVTPGASTGVYAAASWSRADSIELQIRTAEGDVATLSFAQSSSTAMTAGVIGTAAGTSEAWSWASDDASTLSLQVEGDLNETELAAIDALASQVDEVAEEFLQGDLDTALSLASQISLAGDQNHALSAFSYEMRSTEVVAATAMLERVAPPATEAIEPLPVGSTEATTPPSGPSAAVLMQQLLALLERLGTGRDGSAAPIPPLPPTEVALAAEPAPPDVRVDLVA